MVGLSFLQVVLRLCFASSLLWADIFLRHLVLWVGFLGAALAASSASHSAIDLVKKILPEKFRRPVHVLVHLCACAALILLSGAALRFFKDDMDSNSILFTIGATAVPSYWMNVMIPVGFILLLLHFALGMFSGDPEKNPAEP